MAVSASPAKMTQKMTATLCRPSEALSGLMQPMRHHPAPPSIYQASSLAGTQTLKVWKDSSLGVRGLSRGGTVVSVPVP